MHTDIHVSRKSRERLVLVWKLGGLACGFHFWRLEVVGEVGFQIPAQVKTVRLTQAAT